MRQYRLQLTLDGPLGTPLTGDTLFGHLCWGMVYNEGSAALGEFLEQMRSNQPPLVISDPLPEGFLPNPVLPASDAQEYERMEVIAGSQEDVVSAHDRLKRIRKQRWLPEKVLSECIDDLSASGLVSAAMEADLAQAPSPAGMKEAVVAHNTLNRLTQHTVEEGGLFQLREWFPAGQVNFTVYILSTLEPGRIRDIFEQGLASGYGRDASTGKGKLIVGKLDESSWPAAEEPNAGLALGVFAPAEDDPTQGWWRSEVRLGKLGGAWAGEDPPFKFPLTLLTAGSLLGPLRKPYFGRVVDGVHPTRQEVVTCAISPVLPVRCPVLTAPASEALK
ncbi:MAG: type III-A CRISPR-associated RAMP protein Csm4 [Phycisphaerae bacterium]